LRLWVVW